MAQIRRPPRYRSPPPRHIPSLPHPVRIQPATRIKIRTIPSQPEPTLFNLTSANNPMEESLILPSIITETNELLERKHLPVYARFPFDLSVNMNKENLCMREREINVLATAVTDNIDNFKQHVL